jgi:hypothetical protein
MTSGGCLCGAVGFEVHGALRDVVICHCRECRRWHGHVGAYTSANRDDLVLTGADELRWIESPDSDAGARRGFCGVCGSSLFWEVPERGTVSIAAGTLHEPTGLRVSAHEYVSQAGDYYELADDGIPRHERAL